jgi:hypothetical protein
MRPLFEGHTFSKISNGCINQFVADASGTPVQGPVVSTGDRPVVLELVAGHDLVFHQYFLTEVDQLHEVAGHAIIGSSSLCASLAAFAMGFLAMLNRHGMEEFVIAVIRRAAVELYAYTNTTAPIDKIEPFLMSVKSKNEPTS